MVAYKSGEASSETRKLVDEHLACCATCREAFGKEPLVEKTLAGLGADEKPSNGRRFIGRTRRLLFAIGAGILFLSAFLLAFFQRVVLIGMAGISKQFLPGSSHHWLILTAFMAALYILLLLRLMRKGEERRTLDILVWILPALPLLVIALGAFQLFVFGTVFFEVVAVLSLLGILVLTFVLLPRLPYITIITVLILLLVNGILLGQIVAGGFVLAGDFIFMPDVEFGHPSQSITPGIAVQVDMSSLGLELAESMEIERVGRVILEPSASGATARYEGGGRRIFLTVVKLGDEKEAKAFYKDWKKMALKGIQVFRIENNIPGLWGPGRYVGSYSALIKMAYNAWQIGEWVTIIEAPGSLRQTRVLIKDVKKLVLESFSRSKK